MEDILNQILKLISDQGWGAALGVVIGLFGPKLIGPLRTWTSKTPTPVDDMLVSGLEALCTKSAALNAATPQELEKVLTTPQIAELVRLRKARIAAQANVK